MELTLEAVALFSLKLVHETDGGSPILRDDPAMSDYQRDVFAFELNKGNFDAIQLKVERCLDLALEALGGAHTAMGRELLKLSGDFTQAQTLEQMHPALMTLKDYLKEVQ